jgi:hypothetical protein
VRAEAGAARLVAARLGVSVRELIGQLAQSSAARADALAQRLELRAALGALELCRAARQLGLAHLDAAEGLIDRRRVRGATRSQK